MAQIIVTLFADNDAIVLHVKMSAVILWYQHLLFATFWNVLLGSAKVLGPRRRDSCHKRNIWHHGSCCQSFCCFGWTCSYSVAFCSCTYRQSSFCQSCSHSRVTTGMHLLVLQPQILTVKQGAVIVPWEARISAWFCNWGADCPIETNMNPPKDLLSQITSHLVFTERCLVVQT